MATSIAVIAVASIGLLMLSGRVRMRRGATVILGCFILFGVATIAQGFRAAATSLSYSTAPADPDPIGSDARRASAGSCPSAVSGPVCGRVHSALIEHRINLPGYSRPAMAKASPARSGECEKAGDFSCPVQMTELLEPLHGVRNGLRWGFGFVSPGTWDVDCDTEKTRANPPVAGSGTIVGDPVPGDVLDVGDGHR